MRATITPEGSEDPLIEVEMEEGDRLSVIIAQVALPYLRRRAELGTSVTTPLIANRDLPAWLRRKGDDERNPPKADGRDGERWSYVIGETIWAMEATAEGLRGMRKHLVRPGKHELVPSGDRAGSFDIVTLRPGTVDMDGVITDAERRQEGMRLFARYIASI